MPTASKVVAATDWDAGKARLAGIIRESIKLTGREDLVFAIHQPAGFKDWNDQLRGRPTPSPLLTANGPSVT